MKPSISHIYWVRVKGNPKMEDFLNVAVDAGTMTREDAQAMKAEVKALIEKYEKKLTAPKTA